MNADFYLLLHSLLPEEISDESTYHLVNFVSDLASALDSRYFSQLNRYHRDNHPLQPPEYIKKNILKIFLKKKRTIILSNCIIILETS
jgi:hypothetical protein